MAIAVTAKLLLAGPAIAQSYEAGDWRVSNLRVDTGAVYVTLSPAPAGCQGGNNFGAHLLINMSRPNFQALYSTLLTAYTANLSLSGIWYVNQGPCSGSPFVALDTYMIRLKER